MKKKIYDRLKDARQLKALKQKDMSEKMGISRGGYSRIETGKVELTTKNLLKIADILDISLDWLILGNKDQTKQGLNFSHFGKYAGPVELLFNEMKKSESMMHGVLSFFFDKKGKNEKRDDKKAGNRI